MSVKDSGGSDGLKEYLSFANAHPTLFKNPSQDGFVILLDENQIRQVETTQANRLRRGGLPPHWAKVGVVYEDQYILILRDAVRFPDDSIGTYIRIVAREEEPLGVVMLPVIGDRVLLLNHFRHATRSWHLEFPRGGGTAGLSAEESARRELKEETGAIATEIVSLGQVYTNSGMTSECIELFLARVTDVGRPEQHEAIREILAVDLPSFEDLIHDGRITDSLTIAAYCRARLRGLL